MGGNTTAGRNGRSLGGRSLALAALVFGSSACGDTTAAWSEFSPERAAQRLDEVIKPLAGDGDLLLGMDLAVGTIEEYGGAWLAQGVALRRAGDDGVLRALQSDRSRGSVAAGEPMAAFTIPQELIGETLEWDPGYGYVISGRTGAPLNGVRIHLYRMSGTTGHPIEPLSRIGHVDLIDADNAQAEAVRVRATGTVGPDRVLADYLVSLTGSGTYEEGEMTVTTRGALAQAGSLELDLVQRLEWSRSRDREDLLLDYRYSRGSRSVALEGRATARFDAVEWATFDFSTELLGERPTTGIQAEVGSSGTLYGEILSDGRRVVRIGGYDARPTFERADGGRLSWSEAAELERIWTGITDLIWWTEWVVIPADLLVLDG